MLIYDEKKNKIQIGNEVEAEGKLSFFETARNPGNFDQKAYYQRQNIHGKVWSETLRITDHTVKRIQNVLENIRVHCRNTLLSEAGEKNGSILSAILLGEKSQMDPEIKKLYQVNGLGYVLMIGVTVSVIRAGIMYLFRVGAEIAGRHYDSVTALSVAAAVVLIWRPLSIYDGAFWLSFFAVFAVVVIMPAGQMEKAKTRTEIDIQKNRENKAWIIQIKSMIISNIEMQLFLLPVVLYFFYEFPLYATFLNLLVIPLMTILLSLGITGSFICMLCSGMFKIPGKCMLGICGFILTIYERCCEFFLELPGARVVLLRLRSGHMCYILL